MEKELPKGWSLSTIEDSTEILDNKRKPVSASERAKRIGDIPYYGATGIAGAIDDFIFDEELVLLGEDGAPFLDLGKNVAYLIEGKSWVNNHAHVLKAKLGISSNQFDYTDYVGGTTRLKLNQGNLKKIPFPLPPLAEQKRIVAKLDTLFASLENTKIRLEKIPTLLKNFKQAVLTQAVTGKLTEQWREGKVLESGKELLKRIVYERSKILNAEIEDGKTESKRIIRKLEKLEYNKPSGSIPKGWEWTCFMESCLKVVDCHNKTAPYVDEGIRLLRTTNIKGGKIVLEGSKFITEETYDYWSKRCPPKPLDILFTREAPMGEAVIIPEGMKVCMGQRMMLLRTIPGLISSQYILYNILDYSFQDRMISNAIGTGVKHLRVGDVERLTFPLPSFQEQTEIVRRVESLFAKVDAIEQQYQSLKKKVDTLPQAILAKAFRGELVEQNPLDEPASVLLEKIQALRQAQGPVKRKTVRKKKSSAPVDL